MMILKTLRHRHVLIVGMILLMGCSSAAPSTGSPSVPVTPEPSISTAASPTPSDDPSPSAEPSAASSVGQSGGLLTDWIAETIVDRVRVRSLPVIDDGSIKYEPLLRTGTRLFVLDGPVAGSGYVWYQVLPIDSEEGGPATWRSGWVAFASRDGEPWLRDSKLDCPVDIFEDFAAILKLGGAGGLSCYGATELSFLASVLSCLCDGGGPHYEPSWLIGYGRIGGVLLAAPWLEPAQAWPPFPDDLDMIGSAFHPGSFGVGEPQLTPGDVYQVTAHYDDPAAATCRAMDDGEAAEPGDPVALIAECRMQLVVTQIEPFAGIDPG